jgi:hypothetical protein
MKLEKFSLNSFKIKKSLEYIIMYMNFLLHATNDDVLFEHPGHPNANFLYFLSKKSPVSIIKLDGLLIGIWKSSKGYRIYGFNILLTAEHLIEVKKTDNFVSMISRYNTGNKINSLYAKELKKEKVFKTFMKNGVEVQNIFSNNFDGLSAFDSILLHNKNFQDYIVEDNDSWKSKKLENIVKGWGLPCKIIGSCTGQELWFYFGYHKCKHKTSVGFIILEITEKNTINSISKHCDLCEKCSGRKSTDELESVDYI